MQHLLLGAGRSRSIPELCASSSPSHPPAREVGRGGEGLLRPIYGGEISRRRFGGPFPLPPVVLYRKAWQLVSKVLGKVAAGWPPSSTALLMRTARLPADALRSPKVPGRPEPAVELGHSDPDPVRLRGCANSTFHPLSRKVCPAETLWQGCLYHPRQLARADSLRGSDGFPGFSLGSGGHRQERAKWSQAQI